MRITEHRAEREGPWKECGSGITSSKKSSLTLAPAQGGPAGSALSSLSPSSDLHRGPKPAVAPHPSLLCTRPFPLGKQMKEGGLSGCRHRLWGSLSPGVGSGRERANGSTGGGDTQAQSPP